MIAQITGTIIQKTARALVIDVAGIGYEIYVTDKVLATENEGSPLTLSTYLAVRENSMELFGFETTVERSFFEMLLDVSGIGPRSALGIISLAPIETLREAIGSGDTTYLTKVSGIGRKTAEKIVVELRDRLEEYATADEDRQEEQDALDALTSLGYSLQESREALKNISDTSADTSTRVKEALKILGS